jgi:hypothetical protein
MLLIIVTANRALRMGCEEIQRHLTPEAAFVWVALKYRHQFDDGYPEFLLIGNLFHQTSIRAARDRTAVCLSSGQDTWWPRDPSLSYSGLEQAAEGRDPGIRVGVLHDECPIQFTWWWSAKICDEIGIVH